uniref:Uncharacterized protein n=1 Tax=Cryptomonas curvata TaxID=233186 RepID=A0A7S0M752_9CRYP|mmetsp:Transcript_24400/g.51017  ORF Transcript_24400/g.51017 Transcript_24400/m.51017 type:complete len:690 (+) Transcript_24400:1470-3539(+)
MSAVQKLCRVMKIPDGLRLYRGLGGSMKLPKCFYKADKHGCRGFTEWAFTSTTTNKEIAFQYSGVFDRNKPIPSVLVIRAGSIDRGACIKEFSQYPLEIEYLWLPGSFVQPAGSTYIEVISEGVVAMIPVRINANLKALTIEEHASKKKNMHLATFKYVKNGIEQMVLEKAALSAVNANDQEYFCGEHEVTSAVLSSIMQSCASMYKKHEGLDNSEYESNGTYTLIVSEMFDLQNNALAELQELSFLRDSFHPTMWPIISPISNIAAPADCLSKRVARTFSEVKTVANKFASEWQKQSSMLSDDASKSLPSNPISQLVERLTFGQGLSDCSLALAAAAENGNYLGVKLAVETGIDVSIPLSRDGRTALMLAAKGGSVETFETLVAYGGNIDYQDHAGMTALMHAVIEKNVLAVHCLVELKADIELTEKIKKRSALLIAAGSSDLLGCFKVLLENEANWDTKFKPEDFKICESCLLFLNHFQISKKNQMPCFKKVDASGSAGSVFVCSSDCTILFNRPSIVVQRTMLCPTGKMAYFEVTVKSLPTKCRVNIGFGIDDHEHEDEIFHCSDCKSIVFPVDLFNLEFEQNGIVFSELDKTIGLACDLKNGIIYASNGQSRHEEQLPVRKGLRGLFPMISAEISRKSQNQPTILTTSDNAHNSFNLKYNFGPTFHFPLEQGFIPFSSLFTGKAL